MSSSFPYNRAKLLPGPVRVLIATISGASPTIADEIGDLIALNGTPTVVSPYVDIGATTDGVNITRSWDAQEFTIEQENSVVLRAVNSVARQLSMVIGEHTPEHWALLENAPGIITQSAASGKSAQKRVPFGGFSDLIEYRVAFLAQRKKAQEVVTDNTGLVRGPWVGYYAYRCTIAAESAQVTISKGNLASIPITMDLYADPAGGTNVDVGFWIEEQAGTIAP